MNSGPTPERAGPDHYRHEQSTARRDQLRPATPPRSCDVLALAAAVAAPRSRVRYLSAESGGTYSKTAGDLDDLDHAVCSGRAFMVDVARNVLAVDADTPDQHRELRDLHNLLVADRRQPVQVDSGRGWHLHAKMPLGAVRYWAIHARDRGLDVRHTIRPPLSPHPDGLPVAIVGATVHEALAALHGPSHGPGNLSPRLTTLLRDGVGTERYRSRSEAVQALLTGMVAQGWPKAYAFAAITTSRWAGTVNEHGGEQWLDRSWKSARTFVDKDRRYQINRVEAVRDAMNATQWARATGRRNRLLLEAHLRAARDSDSVTHLLTNSDAADAVGVTERTVRTARRELERQGWLVQCSTGSGARAATWKLALPATHSFPPTSHTPLRRNDYGGEETRALLSDYGHDAFRQKALGKCAPEVLDVLLAAAGRPLAAAEVARRCASQPHPATIRRILKKASEHGLVVRAEDGWLLVNVSAESLHRQAVGSGTAGTRARQRAHADAERRRRRNEQMDWTLNRRRPDSDRSEVRAELDTPGTDESESLG